LFLTAAFALCVVINGALSRCASGLTEAGAPVKDVLGSMNGEPVVPRRANRIMIPVFSSGIEITSLRDRLTLRVRELIVQDGRLALARAGDEADLALEGNIMLYQVQPVQYNDLGVAVKKRIRMVASVRLLDIMRGKVIFSEAEIQAFEVFSDIIPPLLTEDSARERVIESLARRIALQTSSGWYTELMSPAEKGKKR